jgi:Family of unknown function (DUF6304)
MEAAYPGVYRDRFGQESTLIMNDGKALTMIVRGVTFRGSDFDGFEPQATTDANQLSTFTMNRGELCSCVIETEMMIPICVSDSLIDGKLTVRLGLGDPIPTGGIDRECLFIELRFGKSEFKSNGLSGWFEDEMLDIQKQLPPNTYMKSCINCAFSDYHPVGHGLFGGLACFRDNKHGYRAVKNKSDLLAIWNTTTEFVQETYLCPEFERRAPGTGYRG